MTPTQSTASARLLEHITTSLHDLREDLSDQIRSASQAQVAATDRLGMRVDEQGQRLSKVEARVEMMCGQNTPSRWRRDGGLVVSGGAIVALLDWGVKFLVK